MQNAFIPPPCVTVQPHARSIDNKLTWRGPYSAEFAALMTEYGSASDDPTCIAAAAREKACELLGATTGR